MSGNRCTIATNPQANNLSFPVCGDHTTGKGNMMIVNGAVQSDNVTVWSETVTVSPNQIYTFSGWATSLSAGSPARLGVLVNDGHDDVPIGLADPLSNTPCEWQKFSFSWSSGTNTTVTIRIVNTNTNATGNDFALDDLSFGGTDAIEVGWIVWPDQFPEDLDNPQPHLFVARTVGAQVPPCLSNVGFCYAWEANSGWVPAPNAKYQVGDPVTVTDDPQDYKIQYSQGQWQVFYQNELIGYFPADLWPKNENGVTRFTHLTLATWWGEVADGYKPPDLDRGSCTQMGNGIFGSEPGSAEITDMGIISSDGSETQANATPYVTDPSYYDMLKSDG